MIVLEQIVYGMILLHSVQQILEIVLNIQLN